MARIVLPDAQLQALARLHPSRLFLPEAPLAVYQDRPYLWPGNGKLQALYTGILAAGDIPVRWQSAKNGRPFLRLTELQSAYFLSALRGLRSLWVMDDSTDLTVALDLHRPAPDAPRTEIGELVYQAKYQGSAAALRELCDRAAAMARRLGVARWPGPGAGRPIIVPVPSSKVSQSNLLPARVARAIADALDLPYDPYLLRTVASRPSLKSLALADKARSLQGTLDLRPLPPRSTVLLVDDHYQSGTMVNYLAAALRQSGDGISVFAFACDKTLSNRDNSGEP